MSGKQTVTPKKAAFPATSAALRRRATAEQIGWENVAHVVDTFYDRIQSHPTLAEPFSIIADWDEHKARLTHFWWMALGARAYASYQYEVGPKHAAIGVTSILIDDWLELFEQTMRETIDPDLADSWLFRARRMGDSLRLVGRYYARGTGAETP